MTKPIKEWLQELPGGYRERALKNFNPEHAEMMRPPRSLCDALLYSFDWQDSPEGYNFWSNAYDMILEMTHQEQNK